MVLSTGLFPMVETLGSAVIVVLTVIVRLTCLLLLILFGVLIQSFWVKGVATATNGLAGEKQTVHLTWRSPWD